MHLLKVGLHLVLTIQTRKYRARKVPESYKKQRTENKDIDRDETTKW